MKGGWLRKRALGVLLFFLLINYILHLEYKMRDREGGEEDDGPKRR